MSISRAKGLVRHRDNFNLSMISGFRRGASEICALLWCYTAYIGIFRRLGTTYPSDIQDDADRLPPKRL